MCIRPLRTISELAAEQDKGPVTLARSTAKLQSAAVFEFPHVEGSCVCGSMFPHHTLPDGRQVHFYRGARVADAGLVSQVIDIHSCSGAFCSLVCVLDNVTRVILTQRQWSSIPVLLSDRSVSHVVAVNLFVTIHQFLIRYYDFLITRILHIGNQHQFTRLLKCMLLAAGTP